MSEREAFLETACSIGRRLARRAVWSGDACTWILTFTDRADPRRVLRLPAEGGVYRGAGGIALFLTELHLLAPDPEVARAALGATAHALADPGGPRNAYGFHAGRVGTAYAATRAGEVFARPELREAADRLLRATAAEAPEVEGLDVVGGAAGGIPVLLRLASVLDREVCTGLAVRLGETLLQRARDQPRGRAWPDPRPGGLPRPPIGLAHGAAGMGAALFELYAATGDARFRDGGEQAFAYERQYFDPAAGNWRDPRQPAPGEEGAAPPERWPCAWCNGAPGMALTRLRALEVTGDPRWRGEAEAALATTERAVEAAMGGARHGLCHGASGNAAVLLHGAAALGTPALRETAERAGTAAAERYERAGVPWPCGVGEPDPSLMLGEAGIGYLYLHLAADDVPSVLLPVAEGAPAAVPA